MISFKLFDLIDYLELITEKHLLESDMISNCSLGEA
jgi:hypothetical protein